MEHKVPHLQVPVTCPYPESNNYYYIKFDGPSLYCFSWVIPKSETLVDIIWTHYNKVCLSPLIYKVSSIKTAT